MWGRRPGAACGAPSTEVKSSLRQRHRSHDSTTAGIPIPSPELRRQPQKLQHPVTYFRSVTSCAFGAFLLPVEVGADANQRQPCGGATEAAHNSTDIDTITVAA